MQTKTRTAATRRCSAKTADVSSISEENDVSRDIPKLKNLDSDMSPAFNNHKRPSCERIIRMSELVKLTGLSRTAIYNKSSAKSKYFDSTFPKRFKINNEEAENSAVGWLLSEVNDWIISRSTKRLFNS